MIVSVHGKGGGAGIRSLAAAFNAVRWSFMFRSLFRRKNRFELFRNEACQRLIAFGV